MPARPAGLGGAGDATLGSKFPPMPLGESIVGDKVGRPKLWTMCATAHGLLAFYPIFDHLDFSAMIAALG
jgi:hypothetical protein